MVQLYRLRWAHDRVRVVCPIPCLLQASPHPRSQSRGGPIAFRCVEKSASPRGGCSCGLPARPLSPNRQSNHRPATYGTHVAMPQLCVGMCLHRPLKCHPLPSVHWRARGDPLVPAPITALSPAAVPDRILHPPGTAVQVIYIHAVTARQDLSPPISNVPTNCTK